MWVYLLFLVSAIAVGAFGWRAAGREAPAEPAPAGAELRGLDQSSVRAGLESGIERLAPRVTRVEVVPEGDLVLLALDPAQVHLAAVL